MPQRSTIVVSDRLTWRRVRTEHALTGASARRILTLPSLAAHLAGGFARSATAVDVRRALHDLPTDGLGSLAAIADLPGFARAAADTLAAIWAADVDVEAIAAEEGPTSRWAELAVIERHVRDRLPAAARTPRELVGAACARVRHAPRAVGSVHLERVDEVAPVYRPLLEALAGAVRVTWRSTGATRPAWAPPAIEVERPASAAPSIEHVECADPVHEVVEALRWARHLLAEGHEPTDIAITAVSVEEHDATFAALIGEIGLPLHLAHGVAAVTTPSGQAAAALADLVVRGLSHERIRRFVTAARSHGAPEVRALPHDWARVLPRDAALATLERWRRALDAVPADAWPGETPYGDVLLAIVESLEGGGDAAAASGERWLRGRARELWRRALDEGPVAAIDVSLQNLRVDDGVDPAAAVVWAPAAWLVGSPRPHVRLLGLASQTWPRRGAEDALLPRHVLGGRTLRERSTARRDREHFATLLAASSAEVVLSRPRRGPDGRRRAPSPLVRPWAESVRRLRPRDPAPHAMSEADRRASRLAELQADPFARAAAETWRDWQSSRITPHDGLVRAHHPAIARALGRVHSATSLRLLLRDPLGFVAKYALSWSEPAMSDEPLLLDGLALGDLVHRVLQRAVGDLEDGGGFAGAPRERVHAAIDAAVDVVAEIWTIERPVPPPVLWRSTLDEVRTLARTALEHEFPPLDGQRSFAEVPFGRAPERAAEEPAPTPAPWPPDAPVFVPGTDVELRGVIDRLDLAGPGHEARVIDYKTGRGTFTGDIQEGAELQRALYASAVRSLLGSDVAVDASLLHLRKGEAVPLDDPNGTLALLARALHEARDLLLAGNAFPGPDAFGEYAEHALALPADASTGYRERKGEAFADVRARLDAILAGAR
jgi:hypothetical protein